MKVGLLDVDSHNFPNLPLMKISAWYKSKNDNVEKIILIQKYDIVYVSKIFDFTDDYLFHINADKLVKSGTGYGLDNKFKVRWRYEQKEIY